MITVRTQYPLRDYSVDQRLVLTGEGGGGGEYTAGAGLSLSGNEFSVDSKTVVMREGTQGVANGLNSAAIGQNTVTYTDNCLAEGEWTQAGTRSFRIVSGDIQASTWTLKTTEGIRPGYAYTVRLLNNYDMAGTVVSVLDSRTISVDGFPTPRRAQSEYLSDPYLSGQPWYGALSASGVRAHPSPTGADEYRSHTGQGTYPPEYCFYDFDFDANSMWFLGHPEIGDISAYATGAHAEGYMTQAGRQYSHAEGLSSMTVGKYAHAEGWQTVAVWAAHSEGYMTSAFGQRSHAEGSNTLARGSGSLACGVKSVALGDNSFAYNGVGGQKYVVSGNGQFGINPVGAEWGFYVGGKPLGQIVADSVPDLEKIDRALSTDGYEFDDVSFDIVPDMHINSNPGNTAIGQPIAAKTSGYVGEYCMVRAQAGEQYEISTRLGDNMCIMLFEQPYVPLSSYEGYLVKSNYQYKRFEIEIPDGCRYMTVDNYTKSTSEHMPISVKRKSPKYCSVSEILGTVGRFDGRISGAELSAKSFDQRIGALERDYSAADALADEILNG